MCVFQRKTGHISETVRDRAVAAISSRQWGDDMAKSGNCWGDACI